MTFPFPTFCPSAPYVVPYSCSLDGSTEDFSKTFSGAGNQKTHALSIWLKDVTSGFRWIMGSGSNMFYVTSGALGIQFSPGNFIQTSSTYSFSTWRHILFQVDTTTDTYTISVDGSAVAAPLGGGSLPSTNADLTINSAAAHSFCSNASSSLYLDGLIADPVFVSGVLPMSSVYDSGPVDPSGVTPGTNGFHFNFTETDMGADQLGSNDWTANNITTADRSSDVPA